MGICIILFMGDSKQQISGAVFDLTAPPLFSMAKKL
jgi:hypothetical protein